MSLFTRAFLSTFTALMTLTACDLRAPPSTGERVPFLDEILAEEQSAMLALERSNPGEGTRRKSMNYEDHVFFARTLVGECGRCSDLELTAIAYVIVNRLDSGRWGSTISDVVLYSRGSAFAFTTWDPKNGNLNEAAGYHVMRSKPFAKAWTIAETVWQDPLRKADPTNGATHYWHPDAMKIRGATPRWAKNKPYHQIGGARFTR